MCERNSGSIPDRVKELFREPKRWMGHPEDRIVVARVSVNVAAPNLFELAGFCLFRGGVATISKYDIRSTQSSYFIKSIPICPSRRGTTFTAVRKSTRQAPMKFDHVELPTKK